MPEGESGAFLLRGVGRDGQSCRVHTIAFDAPRAALTAVTTLRREKFEVVDVHSPFPIHGIEAALGWRETRLGYATLVGGLFGFAVGLALQVYTHGVDWPLNIGGKTAFAWPAMVPVLFELTILFAAIATVGTLLFSGRLRPRLDLGRPTGQPGDRVNDDRFVVVVLEHDGSFSMEKLARMCRELGAAEVVEAWKVLS